MIPLFKPYYDGREINAIAKVLASRWTGMGSVVERFEKEFADYIGVKYAVAVNSCTSALNLAVKCLVLKGNILTTPLTFISTVSAIVENNNILHYGDIDSKTMNLDEVDCYGIDAVIPVHYAGRPCDMDKINWIAKKRNMVVIEDAAHACGASYNGKKAGSLGDCGCFSFHAVKNLSCGDGGMITTNNKELYERLRKLRWCGIDKNTYERNGWEYEIEECGFKYHMNDITAAIGLVQLEKLDEMNAKRKRLAERYREKFQPDAAIAPPVKLPMYDDSTYQSSWHLYPIQIENRERLYKYLKENGVGAGVHYKPTYKFKAYKQDVNLPNVESVWKNLLSLPMYPEMTDKEQDKVIGSVNNFVNKTLIGRENGRTKKEDFNRHTVLPKRIGTDVGRLHENGVLLRA